MAAFNVSYPFRGCELVQAILQSAIVDLPSVCITIYCNVFGNKKVQSGATGSKKCMRPKMAMSRLI
jgi:hypothetical protein